MLPRRRPGRRARTFTVNGHIARSGYEVKVMRDLAARGIPYSYEPNELEIQLPVIGGECTQCSARAGYICKHAKYTVDVRLDNGRYIELKGKLGPKDRTRLKALYRAWNGRFPRPLSVLLQKDNWCTKKHRERYSDWCRKIGFDVSVGDAVPEEWLE